MPSRHDPAASLADILENLERIEGEGRCGAGTRESEGQGSILVTGSRDPATATQRHIVCTPTFARLRPEGRLKPRPENRRQRANSTGLIDGMGIRFVPVVNSGNKSESLEEIERISELIGDLWVRLRSDNWFLF